MPGKEEEALISRAKAGDACAFGVLYEKHRVQVRNVVSGRVRDPDDQDDLVQMTFVRAYRALPRFRGGSLFSTWLHRIALNLCISHHKSAWNRKVRLDEMEDPEGFLVGVEAVSKTPRPDQAFVSRSIEEIAHAEIKRLPDTCRRPAWLRFVEDLSYQELSQQLHCPMGTIKVKLYRGRQQLQEKLAWLDGWN